MRDLSIFGFSTLATILLAKISLFAGFFGFLQGTSGLWYPISVGISSLGFRTELVPKGAAMVLFIAGTTLYIAVKAESFADQLANRVGWEDD